MRLVSTSERSGLELNPSAEKVKNSFPVGYKYILVGKKSFVSQKMILEVSIQVDVQPYSSVSTAELV